MKTKRPESRYDRAQCLKRKLARRQLEGELKHTSHGVYVTGRSKGATPYARPWRKPVRNGRGSR